MKKQFIILLFVLTLSGCSLSVRYSSEVNKKIIDKKVSKSGSKINSNEVINETYYNYDYKYDNQTLQSQLVEYSKNWIGVPYRYGGIDTDGVDCSGFVKNVYNYIGYDLPRTASQQYDFTKKIERSQLKEGDLIFFRRRDKIFHVGIYIGENKLIHASTTKGVVIQDLSDNWIKSNLFAFGRIN